jgi:hypothetical protein
LDTRAECARGLIRPRGRSRRKGEAAIGLDCFAAASRSTRLTEEAGNEHSRMSVCRDNEQEHGDALTATVENLDGRPKRSKTQFRRSYRGRGQQDPGDRRRRGEPQRGGLPRSGRSDPVQGGPRGRSGDPFGGGSACRGAQHRGGQDDRPRRRLRQAGLDGRGAAEGQALPRLGGAAERSYLGAFEPILAAPDRHARVRPRAERNPCLGVAPAWQLNAARLPEKARVFPGSLAGSASWCPPNRISRKPKREDRPGPLD